ncbi:hypothetical protein [Rubinisphaera italica]|uniref:Uncharacterized protein n=1 Tax=Rubinisphaera italica TaxID=2527969 RepID=A0A5C5XCS6_9PLAN|nr:hypothetical protein [Rubinisphaera italica]TWT60866.1 hypothetical protein Pan54_15940 [Rubinisphaera italica]
MARSRNNSNNLEAGSDSFLDIVANIVGILIILIVIAGVRMTQAPPSPVEVIEKIEEDIPQQPLILPPAPIDRVNIPKIAEIDTDTVSKSIPLIVRLGESEEFPLSPDKMPVVTIPKNMPEIDQLQNLLNVERLKKNELSIASQRQQSQLDQLNKTAELIEKKSLQLSNQITSLDKSKKEEEQSYLQLQGQLARLEEAPTDRQTLEHQVVPVTRVVDGKEWHFELRENRISYIPLDELIDQVMSRVRQRLQWIAQYGDYEGLVGPVAGYSVRFMAGPDQRTMTDELTFGRSQMRISLQKWELVPSSTTNRETLEDAEKAGSLFRTELQRISRDDTITFWVYPDSFELYSSLVRIAQTEGYQIAARPLPIGKLIGGSPQGSRSLGQ